MLCGLDWHPVSWSCVGWNIQALLGEALSLDWHPVGWNVCGGVGLHLVLLAFSVLLGGKTVHQGLHKFCESFILLDFSFGSFFDFLFHSGD
jgi:hypothetical protein